MMYNMKLVFAADAGLSSVDGMLGSLGFQEKPIAMNAFEVAIEQTVPFVPSRKHIEAYAEAIRSTYRNGDVFLKSVRFLRYDYIEPVGDEKISRDRAIQIAFQALQLIRMEAEKAGKDPADTDDRLFSELDVEIGELEEIYGRYGVRVHGGSCYEDGQSPKDYDVKRFGGRLPERPAADEGRKA